jgi:hypothetical protein
MGQLVSQAQTALRRARFDTGMTQFLSDLADYATNRER